jgi:hypothetical protein
LRAEVAQLEEPLDAIEARLLSRSPTPSDLLAWAALVLYYSDAGAAGFDDPVGALTRLAKEGDCFQSRAALLAAAVFKAAGTPQDRRA